jgi:hypothetical protein
MRVRVLVDLGFLLAVSLLVSNQDPRQQLLLGDVLVSAALKVLVEALTLHNLEEQVPRRQEGNRVRVCFPDLLHEAEHAGRPFNFLEYVEEFLD